MKNISYDGIGAVVATFQLENAVEAGTVVKMSGGCTVEACESGESFVGMVFDCETPLVAVQVKGFVTVSCSGVVPVGLCALVADGNGGVMAGDGETYLVVDNEEDGLVTLCL